MNRAEVLHGDCLDVLRQMPDNSIDAVVTDPPYGLGFMGKKWDHGVPDGAVWVECLRVLKPGGHLLAFAGTRTQHRMAVRIEDAGFEIRDLIAWVYGSGMPKSHNLRGEHEGWGTALKPALEPITVARKPLAYTVARNVAAWDTGALNIDGCRVAGEIRSVPQPDFSTANGRSTGLGANARVDTMSRTEGRWPANLIHDGSEDVLGQFPNVTSGSGNKNVGNRANGHTLGHGLGKGRGEGIGGDSGSAARFFYCAKASKADRGEGNEHPTVKPTDLMRYLCRLVTPPGGTVLDPFAGSGSTGKAAVLEGFGFVGIELEEASVITARRRIAQAQAEIPARRSPLFVGGA